MAVTGCSTQKNTAKSRWWHSFNARYNTYYNGSLAYIDGSLEKENGNKDNFTEMIPLYTVGNKASRDLGKGNFDCAIEKCQKAIKLHSIKRRPVWDKKRRKTEKDIEWLNRREYNPFLWKAWMLMGRAQFYKGDFDEAASTFSYMSRLYHTQPAIYGRARAWLAKCYIEEGWLYDAEDVIRNMKRDSVSWQARKEWDYTYADYYIHTGEYDKAVPYLRQVIKHEMRRKQRAREWFLMGQLQAALGNKAEATRAYRHVIRQNPPYELEFNARIAMTEVLSEGQSHKMIRRLRRMAKSDKNKDFLDQVYYAIGNIYLSQKDTTAAITAYEKGNTGSTRSGIEKGVLLLKLGDLYWERESYNNAQRCYGEAIGLLDKERKDYKQLSERSKVLDQLVPYTDAVHLQDSLQSLAKMGEKERNEAIDRVIEALKKKEKEERDRQAEQNAQNVMAQNGGQTDNDASANKQNSIQNNMQNKENGLWYFYNPMAVNQGKAAFQRLWGKRENVDNWQRVNKTVVAGQGQTTELTDAQLDSIAHAEAVADSLAQITDSAQNDPHRREYYLAQIPFSAEQMAASNKIIEDGLFNSGVIFKDKLDNLPLSEKALRRLTDNYPDFDKMADAYYHLFLLYSRKNQPAVAQTYVDRLKKEYPQSQWTTLLTDPYFKENARFGEHIEDSLYASTYDAFKSGRDGEVKANVGISATRFPLGANRDKFLFIGGLAKLNDGDADGCLADMKTLVEKYPQSRLGEMAGMIVNGVNQGRRLRGGRFDIGNLWQRRTVVLNDNDSSKVQKLSAERNTDFVFIIAYSPDSVNENALLYQLARYNFTNYMVRNFDISIDDDGGIHRMKVSGFRNYDEALQYARQFHSQRSLTERTGHSRTIIISMQNLPLLGTQFSYDDYDKFYNRHFAPLKISNKPLLSEPDFITVKQERRSIDGKENESDGMTDDGTFIGDEESEQGQNNNTTTVVPEENIEKKNTDNGETVVPVEPSTKSEVGQGTTVIPEDNVRTTAPTTTTVVPLDGAGGGNADNKAPTEPASDVYVPEQPATTKTDTTAVRKPSTPAAKSATGKSALPKAPTTPQATKKKQAENTSKQPAKKLEDEFYFGDDASEEKKSGKENQTKKKEDVVDDEYYDLEGF